jgi:acetyl-CoA C-acetyltransferase
VTTRHTRSVRRVHALVVTLLYEMQKRNAKKGLARLRIDGGMSIAMCVEQ